MKRLNKISMKDIRSVKILILLILNISCAQKENNYHDLIIEARNLYQTKDYKQSGEKYSEAFSVIGNQSSPSDRYNAACSYALSKERDAAFLQLFRIADKENYSNYAHISTDPDLYALHSDKRWNRVLEKIKANRNKTGTDLNKTLVAILDTINNEDQGLRRQRPQVEEKYGRDSEEMKAHWKKIAVKDSANLIKIQKILDEHGWLGQNIIGGRGNNTLFLVLQHSPLDVQVKYLPMMREAVTKGNAQPADLAMLEDRVALRSGKRQIYGSQIGRDPETGVFYVAPIEDPENVDKRRNEVGLGTLADYVFDYDIIWNVEKHKKKTAELEAKKKN